MKTRLAVAGIVLLLAAAAGADDPPAPVSAEPLWFRIVLGTSPPRSVVGWLDETRGTGKGYDVAVFDADGDGSPEARGRTELSIQYDETRTETFSVPEIAFTHLGADWTIGLYSIAEERPRLRGGVAATEAEWNASRGDDILMFAYGELRLHATRGAALEAEPVRLGPPFRWTVESGRRGPAATVTPTLTDAGGFTLSNFWRGDEDVPPRLELLAEGGAVAGADGEYG